MHSVLIVNPKWVRIIRELAFASTAGAGIAFAIAEYMLYIVLVFVKNYIHVFITIFC